MSAPPGDSQQPEPASLNVKATVAFAGAIGTTTFGYLATTNVTLQSTAQLVVIVAVLMAAFVVAATAYLALEEMAWFSRTPGVPWYVRAMAGTALLVSVASILIVSWYAWILGINYKVEL